LCINCDEKTAALIFESGPSSVTNHGSTKLESQSIFHIRARAN
jgi:hypothetical protein